MLWQHRLLGVLGLWVLKQTILGFKPERRRFRRIRIQIGLLVLTGTSYAWHTYHSCFSSAQEGVIWWGTSRQVYCISRVDKDVQGVEENLLVEEHTVGYCGVYFEVLYLSVVESRAPENYRDFTAYLHARVEMEKYQHRFHYWIVEDHEGTWLDLGHNWQAYNIGHFLPVRTTHNADTLVGIYWYCQASGVPYCIISDRGSVFTLGFWKSFQTALGTNLDYYGAFYLQTDGQTETVNQVLEDMLRACIIDFQDSWKDHLLLIEFTCNNSFHTTTRMAPFKTHYRRPCISPIN